MFVAILTILKNLSFCKCRRTLYINKNGKSTKNYRITYMNKINLYLSKVLLIIGLVFGLTIITTACSKDTENWGYVSKFSKISEVKPGESNREDVISKLGSPTSKSVYGKEKWFYIGSEVTKESFFTPEIKNHEIYTVVFNKEGYVESITKKGKEDMTEVVVSEEETATEGNEITMTQQFLGNLGKFNKEGMGANGRRGDPSATRLPRN